MILDLKHLFILMIQLFRQFFLILVLSTLVAGCARNINSTTHTSSALSGKVLSGVVISARPVVIKDHDRLSGNTTGAAMGALTGGVLGNTMGKGSGNTAAMALGAVAGGVAGAMLEDHLTTQNGMEYVVQLDKKNLTNNRKTIKHHIHRSAGHVTMDQSINDSIELEDQVTNMISVVQGNDVIFQPGQRVLVIYSEDRPRLAPRY